MHFKPNLSAGECALNVFLPIERGGDHAVHFLDNSVFVAGLPSSFFTSNIRSGIMIYRAPISHACNYDLSVDRSTLPVQSHHDWKYEEPITAPVRMRTISDICKLNGVLKYMKKGIFRADIATSFGILNTLEGNVPYDWGDAILTGSRGEKWPVQRRIFDAMYEPAPDHPGYFRKTVEVFAVQMDEPFRVSILDGEAWLEGKAGDWVVQNPLGDMAVVANDIFRETYSALEQ